MAPFHDRSADDIDRIIEACVDGFQDAMQRQSVKGDVPFARGPRMIDLNHGSQAVYGQPTPVPVGDRVNALIDAALIDRNGRQAPRDYLGGSRIGEPCARKLAYEYAHAAVDVGKGFDGRTLRIFDAGHQFEALSIRWLRAAGFDLRTHRSDGEQFGFVTANGRIRGHIDGVIVGGPDVGVAWPASVGTQGAEREVMVRYCPARRAGGPSPSTTRSCRSTWPTWSWRSRCSRC